MLCLRRVRQFQTQWLNYIPVSYTHLDVYKRQIENGTDLQERGRLSSPEHSGAGSSEDREIWDAAAHISAALPQDDVVGIAAERKTERAPRTDRPSGERDDGNSDERDGEIAGSERRTQGEQPNEVGSDDEQHQSVGGGNGAEGYRLQLSGHNYNGPSEVPYYHNEDEKAELLRNCIALKDHRKEIATFIAEHEDRKECGNFIKGFFDNTYVEHILDNGQRVGYRAYDDLLTIWKGSYLSRESDAFISWERVANKIYGLILTHEWLSPDEQPLPTVGEQFRLFEEASAEKANQFTLPQEAIDYVLRGAGNISQGRLSTYDQFLKQEGKEKNIAFLKNGYGIGGGSDAIPESGYWESHDGKGIKIYKGIGDDQKSVVLPWNKVEKRIGELIEADRYLTAADKEAYPKYKREKMLRNERYELMREFRSIYEDYNDFERQLGNESAVLSMFELGDCASQFMNGEKRCHFVSGNSFVLPTMRDALHKIIDAKTHLTERAEKMLEALSRDLAKPLEPSYDELNPPPEPEKEYRFSLGDTVHIGADEYSILSIDDKSVLLNDSKFPLLCEEMKREEFDRKIAENPMNDKYLQAVETVPENADGPIDNEKIRITLDSGRDAVHWIYYNPDSDAGGLYVSGDLAFSVFEELVEEYDIANHPENAEKFFSDLEEMSDQFLAEINTPFFLEAEDDYESDYDYIEFTPENILSIHNDIMELNAERQAEFSKTAAQESQTLLSASEREAEVLESVLNKLNIGDIKLAFEDGELVAADGSSNVWRGKQFYDFLVEDAISYDEYGKPNEIDGDVLADFTELCGFHGVEVKDYNCLLYTSGIALLVDRNVPYRLRHVFDIADTNSFHGNEVKLWQMKPEYEEAVTEALENSFGEVDNKTGFADVLLGISELIVSDNFSDYCEKLKSVKHGSFLEEVDDLNTEVYFRGLLKNSVAYMLLTRCGYDAAEYLDAEDFRNICNFNTVDTLNIIGCANRDISEMVLREVAETVRAVERESKAPNRTFEKPKEIKDNITENKTLEGSIENGTDLQERGRLSSPEHSGADVYKRQS